MSSKTLTIGWGTIGAVTGFIGYVSTLPPDTQTGIFAILENVFPPAWRAQIGSSLKAISLLATTYSLYHAAHSGPQTPPVNPPTK